MANGDLGHELDMEALVAELEAFLSNPWAGEWIGLKLCTLLVRFVEEEMVPVATRVAEMGIDPTPIMETVAGLLHLSGHAPVPRNLQCRPWTGRRRSPAAASPARL